MISLRIDELIRLHLQRERIYQQPPGARADLQLRELDARIEIAKWDLEYDVAIATGKEPPRL